MKIFTFCFLVISTAAFAQKDAYHYLISLGKYAFRPAFVSEVAYKQGPGVFQPGSGDEGDLKEVWVYFPERADTFSVFNPGEKPEKEIWKSDRYGITLFVDSITPVQLDTLISSTISLSHRGKTKKIYSLCFELLYADGKRVSRTTEGNVTIQSSGLLSNNKAGFAYLLITAIRFYGDTEKMEITDPIGWKIKY